MPRPMEHLRHQRVVITGAASGIGRATAQAFLSRGARVYGVDLDAEGLASLCHKWEGHGDPGTHGDSGPCLREPRGRFHAHVADVRDAEAMEELAALVFKNAGRVDLLHLNAGVMIGGRVETLAVEEWRRAIEVNLLGAVNGVCAFVPRMMRQGGGGHLVVTASVAGLVGFPLCGPYSASKFGLVGLCESLGPELAAAGIWVTAICPGMVRTQILEMGRVELPGKGRGILDQAMARFALSPEEVASEVMTAFRKRRGGILVMGIGTRPLWWLHRLARGGYGAAMEAICRRALKRDDGD